MIYARALHYQIERLARLTALAGGVVLILLSALTIISVIGRTINAYGFGPIQGDFELVENGTAFVVFCSLPYCQIRFGHVSVDVLSRTFPAWLTWAISASSQIGMMIIALIITRQLYYGMMDKYQWGETSFILQLPAWWGYAACLPASLLWALCCVIASSLVVTGTYKEAS